MENYNNIDDLKYERARKRVKSIAGFYKHLSVYLIINAILIAMKYFNPDHDERFFEFNTFSTAIFWGIGVAFHALGVFGTNIFLGHDWEERKIQQIMGKDKTKKWE